MEQDKNTRDQRQRQEDRLWQGDVMSRSGIGRRKDDQAGGRALSRPRDETNVNWLNLRAEMGNNFVDASKKFHGSKILSSIENPSIDYSNILNCWYGNPHQAWTVIFRASEHNFQADAFHQQCEGAAPSYILVKSDTGAVKIMRDSCNN